jgi:hypothetical protein
MTDGKKMDRLESRYVKALEKMVEAQDRMITAYRTQNLMGGAAAAEAMGRARNRLDDARKEIEAARDAGRMG